MPLRLRRCVRCRIALREQRLCLRFDFVPFGLLQREHVRERHHHLRVRHERRSMSDVRLDAREQLRRWILPLRHHRCVQRRSAMLQRRLCVRLGVVREWLLQRIELRLSGHSFAVRNRRSDVHELRSHAL
jgi:hypothetical protein